MYKSRPISKFNDNSEANNICSFSIAAAYMENNNTT